MVEPREHVIQVYVDFIPVQLAPSVGNAYEKLCFFQKDKQWWFQNLFYTLHDEDVENDGETTLVHIMRKSAKVDKTPAVLKAPQKKPAARRFNIGHIP